MVGEKAADVILADAKRAPPRAVQRHEEDTTWPTTFPSS